MKGKAFAALVLSIAGLVCCVCTYGAPLLLANTLAFGWIGFLGRVLPGLKPDGMTVLAAAIALGLFVLGIHAFGHSWSRRDEARPPWNFRWTIAGTTFLFVLFGAGVAMVGVTHMSYWLFTEPGIGADIGIRSVANRLKSQSHMKQNTLAMHNYSYRPPNTLPPAATFSENGQALHGWETAILNNIEQESLFRQIDHSLPWRHSKNAPHFQKVVSTFINPTLAGAPERNSERFGLNHYSANLHVIRPTQSLKLEEVTDGTSTTFLGGEINSNLQPWGKPMNVRDPALGINRSPRGFGGAKTARGAQMVMVDGSVRFISENVSPEVMRALATPRGGERIDESVIGK